jgi:hypothetical protein
VTAVTQQSATGATIEIERAALYGIVGDPEQTWPVLRELWAPDLFSVEHLRDAAAAAVARLERNDPVDVTLVSADLLAAGKAAAATALRAAMATRANIIDGPEYVRRLSEIRDRRGDPDGTRAKLRASVHRFTAEQLAEAPPPLKYILHPYVPERKVVTLAGPGGSNKTTLLTYLAVCRALGKPFFDRSTPSRGKTAILTTEDGVDDYWRRLAALRTDFGDEFDARAIADSLIVFDLAGEQVRLIEADKGMFYVSPFVEHFAEVLKTEARGADLVICETVSRLVGGVETNESLSVLVNAAERVCKLAGVTMLLVSHVSQEAGRLGLADQYAARGGSALGDNGRSTMVLTRINDKNRKEFLPDAELSRKQMQDLLILTHPKSIGPKADDLLLQRVSTPHGPVLHRAVVKTKEVNRAALRAKVVAIIADLTRSGITVTSNTIEKTYADNIGVAQKEVRKLIHEALKAGELADRPLPGRKGRMLVPTGEAAPETCPATPPAGQHRTAELPFGAPAENASGKLSGSASCRTAPDCRTAPLTAENDSEKLSGG